MHMKKCLQVELSPSRETMFKFTSSYIEKQKKNKIQKFFVSECLLSREAPVQLYVHVQDAKPTHAIEFAIVQLNVRGLHIFVI